ncbi:MAG TPA: hypothetical protein VFN74_01130, partial [Chloroflexota bacterium]|nr:hypothetical protein [Chloroflexota bacterium]
MDVVAPATFYRAVETWPATANDFLSDAARGRPMRPPQRQNPIIYHGISVFATRAALEKRRRDVTAAGHRFPP